MLATSRQLSHVGGPNDVFSLSVFSLSARSAEVLTSDNALKATRKSTVPRDVSGGRVSSTSGKNGNGKNGSGNNSSGNNGSGNNGSGNNGSGNNGSGNNGSGNLDRV